ncbi:MAG: imidazole glycerol phosphate synthase subunit HisF [Bacteroidales bacterium]
MLKKRIIPCLDIRDGRTVKGINFIDIRDAGDPVELAERYVADGADELVFLDITATVDRRKTLVPLVERIAARINIPFTVGGGISTVQDAEMILRAGADKISVNSAAVKDPGLIAGLAARFGSQCVVIAIDTGLVNNKWMVFVNGGRIPTELECIYWAVESTRLGAGEILLTSMMSDGTKNGFSIDITSEVCMRVKVPVIASGGAGTAEHFAEVFTKTGCTGALAASIFHFGELPVPMLKDYLKKQNIPVR